MPPEGHAQQASAPGAVSTSSGSVRPSLMPLHNDMRTGVERAPSPSEAWHSSGAQATTQTPILRSAPAWLHQPAPQLTQRHIRESWQNSSQTLGNGPADPQQSHLGQAGGSGGQLQASSRDWQPWRLEQPPWAGQIGCVAPLNTLGMPGSLGDSAPGPGVSMDCRWPPASAAHYGLPEQAPWPQQGNPNGPLPAHIMAADHPGWSLQNTAPPAAPRMQTVPQPIPQQGAVGQPWYG